MNKSDGDVRACIDLRKANEVIVRGQKAFERLKQLMSSSNALAYFQNECKTRILVDTGSDSLGAVLLQLHGEEWRAVSYASRNLTEVERRNAQTDEEALVLVWSYEKFNLYAYGREFELEKTTNRCNASLGRRRSRS